MADTNVDLMKAQVPAWFQQLTGWESRLVVRVCVRGRVRAKETLLLTARECEFKHTC